MANVDLKSLARLGAQAKLAELIAEMDAILAAFPDLGAIQARPGRRGRPRKAGVVQALDVSEPKVRRRRRSRMSPAQRKAVSARMKRYWAGRRQAKASQTEREAPKSAVKRSPWTPAKRRAAADRARQMWAGRRKKGGR